MILIALGSNVAGPWGNPRETVQKAIVEMPVHGVRLAAVSSLIVTAAFGVTDQPDFVNAVAIAETELQPLALLKVLHAIEHAAGRERKMRWGPRTLDLDVIDYNGVVMAGELVLPHPGISERDFVLRPLAEIAPDWRHPQSGLSAKEMLRALNAD